MMERALRETVWKSKSSLPCNSLVDLHTGEEGAKDESKGESKDEPKEGAE